MPDQDGRLRQTEGIEYRDDAAGLTGDGGHVPRPRLAVPEAGTIESERAVPRVAEESQDVHPVVPGTAEPAAEHHRRRVALYPRHMDRGAEHGDGFM